MRRSFGATGGRYAYLASSVLFICALTLTTFTLQRVWKHTTAVAAILVGLYVATYAGLATAGVYETIDDGFGFKYQRWAPKGFASDSSIDRLLYRFYGPLYQLDTQYWHTEAQATE